MSIDIGMEIGGAYSPADMQDCQKSLAEFAADAENSVQIVFGRGLYVDKNTSQAASVEFVRQRRTNYARSRLQKLAESPEGDFRQAQIGGAYSPADIFMCQESRTAGHLKPCGARYRFLQSLVIG